MKYLAGAYRAAGCDADRAVSYYQRGYYGARRSKCSTAPLSATPIAERPEKQKSRGEAGRFDRADQVAAGTGSEPPPTGDVLRPRVVQTQTIWRPKPEPRPEPAVKLAAAKAEPAPVAGCTDHRRGAGRPRTADGRGATEFPNGGEARLRRQRRRSPRRRRQPRLCPNRFRVASSRTHAERRPHTADCTPADRARPQTGGGQAEPAAMASRDRNVCLDASESEACVRASAQGDGRKASDRADPKADCRQQGQCAECRQGEFVRGPGALERRSSQVPPSRHDRQALNPTRCRSHLRGRVIVP